MLKSSGGINLIKYEWNKCGYSSKNHDLKSQSFACQFVSCRALAWPADGAAELIIQADNFCQALPKLTFTAHTLTKCLHWNKNPKNQYALPLMHLLLIG